MENLVKCPVCRGSKQAMKLGNIMGDCNKCSATGFVKMEVIEQDRKTVADVLAKAKEAQAEKEVIEQVSNVAIPFKPTSESVTIPPIQEISSEASQIIEATKAVEVKEDTETEKRRMYYKRKAQAK